MARPIILSNGELHVGLNDFGMVHDFYYPYVGSENHTIGRDTRHRAGVWVDGAMHWLSDGDWEIHFSYPHAALIGHTVATHHASGVRLEFDDFVDSDMSAFMRNIHIINLREYEREIRFFAYQAFAIGDSRSNTDTVQYLPDSHAILHYRGRRSFVISAENDHGEPFDQYTVGLFGIEGREGSYRDADDGVLSGSNVEHGRVDSIIGFTLAVPAHDSRRVHYSISAGTSIRQALYVDKKIHDEGFIERMYATAQSWLAWLEPAYAAAEMLPREQRDQVIRSAMLLRAHIDQHGAVIASTDSAMLNYERDAYAYSWPRDAAYVMWPLIRLGFEDEPRKMFDFYRRVLHKDGYFAHKYRADGAIGSSWHPYLHTNGDVAPPIQTDETALMLFVFVQFYHAHPSERLLREYYHDFVQPMANFLAEYIDHDTMLPRASYDLWEEKRLTTTYTVAVTYAALIAAAELADLMYDEESAVAWQSAAEDMQAHASAALFDTERGYLRKGYLLTDGELVHDSTLDLSSAFGAFMFGLFPTDSREISDTFAAVERVFQQATNIGLPRYENDNYRRIDARVQGNYWPVTSLWYAQYCLEQNDIDRAKEILDWVEQHSYESGIIAEQIFPDSGYSTSVAPLAWSHAEYIATILDVMQKQRDKPW